MKNIFANLSKDQLDRLFPFYFAIDVNMNIRGSGRSVEKILPKLEQTNLNERVSFIRPRLEKPSFETLLNWQNQLIIFETHSQK